MDVRGHQVLAIASTTNHNHGTSSHDNSFQEDKAANCVADLFVLLHFFRPPPQSGKDLVWGPVALSKFLSYPCCP